MRHLGGPTTHDVLWCCAGVGTSRSERGCGELGTGKSVQGPGLWLVRALISVRPAFLAQRQEGRPRCVCVCVCVCCVWCVCVCVCRQAGTLVVPRLHQIQKAAETIHDQTAPPPAATSGIQSAQLAVDHLETYTSQFKNNHVADM